MPLAPDLLGTCSGPVEYSWTRDDVLLYALAVGAGQADPTAELAFTTENTEGVSTVVLPTYAAIMTRVGAVPLGDVDRTKLVHAEQTVRLHAPLPVEGRVRVTAEVTGVFDKGSGAIVETTCGAVDTATDTPLATTIGSVFLRGEGGFGGPRGGSSAPPVPETAPDEVVRYATAPNQALLYRLTNDRNPLHSDPAFAGRGGYDRPILHGMCTYGFTARALLHTVCGGDPARFGAMSGRFTAPVFPGDELTVSIWRDEAGEARFRTTRDRDGTVVIDRGRLAVAEGWDLSSRHP
ncbi:MaoC family dehydratase N-terminal domain-containing protein [Pseudonocardia kujensis]|uniref:MaoC family dehydratase n=1 Tax=Pseudonocardia kujensis TaxID=1128675 RepID=UPI001E29AB50|nr:MaoC family dehydratase [Pseudonocardia kujensis]MCE0767808.1 MaoC family dehydratase N-terminal domain-containing protein [Pseudonocardia kujensis]